jgi:hypothetical protein
MVIDHQVSDLGGGQHLRRANAHHSPWTPSPSSNRPGSTVNSGLFWPGSVHPLKATPNERRSVRLHNRVNASTSSNESPRAAQAPQL